MTDRDVLIRLSASLLAAGAASDVKMNMGSVLKGILDDFTRMAREAGTLRQISEEYRTDDGRYCIRLSGGWDGHQVIYKDALVEKI